MKESCRNAAAPKPETPRDHRKSSLLTSLRMLQFRRIHLRGVLPKPSSPTFFSPSLGMSTPPLLHRSFCHLSHDSWEAFLCCVLPWLPSPTAVWASRLSPPVPAAPVSSAEHSAKCEVIKTQKTPPLGWGEDGKAHICQKQQQAANFLPNLKVWQGEPVTVWRCSRSSFKLHP